MQIDNFIKEISGLLLLFFHIRGRPHKTTREDVKRVAFVQAECVLSCRQHRDEACSWSLVRTGL